MKDHKAKLEYVEYISSLSDKDAEWVKQFYQEYYFGLNADKNIIPKDEKVEIERFRNARRRDIYEISELSGNLSFMGEDDRAFMEDASDESEIMSLYDQGGLELAVAHIMNRAIEDLKSDLVDKFVTLTRFYLNMRSVIKHHKREVKLKGRVKK